MLAVEHFCFKDRSAINDFTCICCLGVFFKPMIDPCGHTYCQPCILLLAKSGDINCPCSRKIFKADQLKANLSLEKMLGVFELKCVHYDAGCKWSGLYKDFEHHLYSDCINKLFNCPNAGCSAGNMDRQDFQEHAYKCDYFVSTCEHCQKLIARKDAKEHKDYSCQEIIVPCKFCKKKMARKLQQKHMKVCEEGLFPCAFFEHHCWTYDQKRDFYRIYYPKESNIRSHLFYIQGKIRRNSRKLVEFLEALIKNNQSALHCIQNEICYFFLYGPMDDPVGRRGAMIAMSY